MRSHINKIFLVTIVAAFAAVVPTGNAAAQDAQLKQKIICSAQAVTPDMRIEACTSLINNAQNANAAEKTTIYNLRGIGYAAKGQYEQAIRDHDEAIRISSSSAESYGYRARANTMLGRNEQALADYGEAIRLNPKSISFYSGRGLTYAAMNDSARAIQDYDRAIELDPKNVAAILSRGIAHGRANQHDKAIADFDEALRINPNDTRGLSSRGLQNAKAGHYQRAIEDYERAIQLSPSMAHYYTDYAWLRAAAKDERFRNGSEAVRLAQKAVELNAKDPFASNALAVAYIENGDPQRALEAYRASLSNSTPAQIRRLQEELRQRGLYAGDIDGKGGPAIDAAIKACVEAKCKLREQN